jgi:hypothetical protein
MNRIRATRSLASRWLFRSKLRVAGLSAVATVVLVGGAAFATGTIPGPDGMIRGCFDRQNGNLRVVSDAGQCRENELVTQWNQVGPQGVQGDPGPIGATGPAGPQGPSGTTSVVIRHTDFVGSGTFRASCLTGEVAISGGYVLSPIDVGGGVRVTENRPVAGAWEVSTRMNFNDLPFAGTVYAVCVAGSSTIQ